MTFFGSSRPPKRLVPPLAEVIALACVSAGMYRLQQDGDPLMIVWAAGAIIVLTAAVTIARAVERCLSRVFGIAVPGDDADEE